MKISKRDVSLLIGFVGILIGFLAYQFGYVRINEKVEAMETQNTQMRTEISQLEALQANQTFYEDETTRMQGEITDKVNEFASDVLPEDEMKFAYQQDSTATIGTRLFVTSMSFADPELLYTTNQQDAQADAAADGTTTDATTVTSPDGSVQLSDVIVAGDLYPTMYLYQTQTNYGVECSYTGIKNMVKAIMHGCNGHMGRVITDIIKNTEGIELVAGVDKYTKVPNDYPVFESIGACDVEADVIIDFSNAAAADELLDYCVEKQVPVVLCTTGLSEEQLEKVEESAKKVAVLKSANMSLGINLLMKILKDATKVLSPAGYDIELVEKHHNQKLDAPSGTALALADSINEAADNQYHYVYDRSQVRQKRDQKEIGISAVRGGTIVGDHEVIFAGQDEVIEFKHTAYSKAVFGKGAVEAAKFLAGKPAGRYDMSDVIQL